MSVHESNYWFPVIPNEAIRSTVRSDACRLVRQAMEFSGYDDASAFAQALLWVRCHRAAAC